MSKSKVTFLDLFDVMDVKTRSKSLKPNQLLVKLRKPGEKPFWEKMSREEFYRGKKFITLPNN
jgi:hypothetical protein